MDNTFRYLNTNILIIGSKESGKTSLVRGIYKKIQSEINEVHVVSRGFHKYSDITNAIYDYNSADTLCNSSSNLGNHIINSILKKCQENPNTNKLVVIDHIYLDQLESINSSLSELLYHGRHYNVTVILAINGPTDISPEFRNQISYVFTSSFEFYSDQKKLHDFYFYMYQSFDYFREQILKLQRYEFLGVKIQSSPYADVFKTEINNDLRFIPTTKYYDNKELNNSKEELLNQVIDIVSDMVDSLNKLTDILKILKDN